MDTTVILIVAGRSNSPLFRSSKIADINRKILATGSTQHCGVIYGVLIGAAKSKYQILEIYGKPFKAVSKSMTEIKQCSKARSLKLILLNHSGLCFNTMGNPF